MKEIIGDGSSGQMLPGQDIRSLWRSQEKAKLGIKSRLGAARLEIGLADLKAAEPPEGAARVRRGT